jgi:hypothetical protein
MFVCEVFIGRSGVRRHRVRRVVPESRTTPLLDCAATCLCVRMAVHLLLSNTRGVSKDSQLTSRNLQERSEAPNLRLEKLFFIIFFLKNPKTGQTYTIKFDITHLTHGKFNIVFRITNLN